MRTRGSTRRTSKAKRRTGRDLSGRILVSLAAIDVSVAALFVVGAELLQQRNYLTAYLIIAEAIAVVVLELVAVRRLLRRLEDLHIRAPDLAFHYEHLWIFCKNPVKCSRCQGWWVGFAAIFAVALAYVAGIGDDIYIPSHIGPALSIAVGVILMSLTPIHGTIGRMAEIKKGHWLEGSLLTAACGLAFAIGVLASAQAAIYLIHAA